MARSKSTPVPRQEPTKRPASSSSSRSLLSAKRPRRAVVPKDDNTSPTPPCLVVGTTEFLGRRSYFQQLQQQQQQLQLQQESPTQGGHPSGDSSIVDEHDPGSGRANNHQQRRTNNNRSWPSSTTRISLDQLLAQEILQEETDQSTCLRVQSLWPALAHHHDLDDDDNNNNNDQLPHHRTHSSSSSSSTRASRSRRASKKRRTTPSFASARLTSSSAPPSVSFAQPLSSDIPTPRLYFLHRSTPDSTTPCTILRIHRIQKDDHEAPPSNPGPKGRQDPDNRDHPSTDDNDRPDQGTLYPLANWPLPDHVVVDLGTDHPPDDTTKGPVLLAPFDASRLWSFLYQGASSFTTSSPASSSCLKKAAIVKDDVVVVPVKKEGLANVTDGSLHGSGPQQPTGSRIHRMVTAGTLQVHMVASPKSTSPHEVKWSVQLYVTSEAPAWCHPTVLPVHHRRSSSSHHVAASSGRLEAVQDLHSLFAEVWPKSVVQDAVNTDSLHPSAPVTAKHVYAVTDNVQLQQALVHPRSLPPIPGLLPRLRPYQEQAVAWMLQREQSPPLCSNEWELAWVVFQNDHVQLRKEEDSSTLQAQNGWISTCSPLPTFLEQHPDIQDTDPLLLYSPFVGWLASSIEEARCMTLGADSTVTTRGGILAESMGLGKTVEVLACVLAHPRPSPSRQGDGASGTGTKLAKMQPDEDEQSVEGTSAPSVGTVATPPRKIGIVDDNMAAFGDADDDDDDDEDENNCVAPDDDQTVIAAKVGQRAVPVTPEKEETVNVRWLDEDVIGSCICGELISFSSFKDKVVALCKSCDEPMHWECAAFETDAAVQLESSALRLRRTFTNDVLECRICDEIRCPCCAVNSKDPSSLILSRATLIVTPPAILQQWEREIRKHAGGSVGTGLKVIVYEGVRKLCKSTSRTSGSKYCSMALVHPRNLADADIVLITFDVLMADLGHSDDNPFVSGTAGDETLGGLRSRKKYRVVPSPLTSIKWWRVCLDEAQRVETPTAGSARMALKLHADHRWCVTGTPIGKGKLDDLFGLLLFLRVHPFATRSWFQKCFNPSLRGVNERIRHLLGTVFWRSTKELEMVRNQMGIPEQVERKIVLKFSSIERHFYDRQLECTLLAAGDVAERETSGQKRKVSLLESLAEHLHRLRAACCHPQVGSSGIGKTKKHRVTSRNKDGTSTSDSISNRVMSMSQILDIFIEDAKQKCEEAQRRVLMHTNAMASLSKLKTEAKERRIDIQVDDVDLLSQCCKHYEESLTIATENAKPTPIVGEASLRGSVGFRSTQLIVRNGVQTFDWKWAGQPMVPCWCRIDLEGPARKITQIRMKVLTMIPREVTEETSEEYNWVMIHPKTCVFQVASAAVGDEFVDVVSIHLPRPGKDGAEAEWHMEGGFITNKSKSWRLMIPFFHECTTKTDKSKILGHYTGVQIELYEADIAIDPLQRLHCLHNLSISYASLLQLKLLSDNEVACETEDLRERVETMSREANKIESLYMEVPRALHNNCQLRLEDARNLRRQLEQELFSLARDAARHDPLIDCWDDGWWDDFLVVFRLYGTESQQQTLCERILNELDGVLSRSFDVANREGVFPIPEFGDINGLRTVLQLRIRDIRSGMGSKSTRKSETARQASSQDIDVELFELKSTRFKCSSGAHAHCMDSIANLSASPSEEEVFENSNCRVCKADWFKTGPKCRHCKISDTLDELSPDKVTLQVLTAIHAVVRSPLGNAVLKGARESVCIWERAKKFFDLIEAQRREKVAAWRYWRVHLDLLNDLDELNQCKTSMRLTYDGEDLSSLQEYQLNGVVVPIDVGSRYYEHEAKQAMSIGDLRRAKDTLRFLKNSRLEEEHKEKDHEDELNCAVCLTPFDGDRAVLRCGHSFHLTPCLEKLKSRCGSQVISCPLRCRERTDTDHVLIASDKRKDDGSVSKRQVRGSWGTKVTRLVADLLDLRDAGDKGIVFSQWEDMLDIVEEALTCNGVVFVRASSARQISATVKHFRDRDCTVFLLNVKNGAEGLTVLEATHVFMVEPILNHGLDSQAINRIHRIGQNRKTYVWRYLVADTIEMKIDRLRMEHHDDQVEDAIYQGRKASVIKAGGIDGGFETQEELLDMLKP